MPTASQGINSVWALLIASLLVASLLCASACSAQQSTSPSIASTFEPTDWDMKYYQSNLEEFAAAFGIENPPEVAIIRWVKPEESTDVLVECLQNAGFPVQRTEHGYEYNSDVNDGGAYDLAQYTCMAQYPVESTFARPMTQEQARRLYDYIIDTQIPCLEANGYGPFDLPTFESYLQTIQSPDMYFPTQDIFGGGGAGGQEYESVMELCPDPDWADIFK